MIIDINNLTESKYQTGAVFSDYNSYYWRVKRKNTDGIWSDWSEGFNFNIMMSIPELNQPYNSEAVSYTHLRAHETVLDLVCRLLLEKKKKKTHNNKIRY